MCLILFLSFLLHSLSLQSNVEHFLPSMTTILQAIMAAIEKLSKTHAEHISQYGTGNEQRLTGKHETCDMNTFRYGVADRGSSIRIPLPVQLKGYGYLEDRRPAGKRQRGCLDLPVNCGECGNANPMSLVSPTSHDATSVTGPSGLQH